MRMRRKPWARPELEECKYFIDNPKEQIGKWKHSFINNQPIHLELGAGKGVFIADLAVKHPEINYIAIDIKSDVLGYAIKGFYNYYETANNEGYTWYRIADNQWVAYNEEWDKIYPAKPKDKYVQFKVLSEKDGYVEIDLGKIFVKK